MKFINSFFTVLGIFPDDTYDADALKADFGPLPAKKTLEATHKRKLVRELLRAWDLVAQKTVWEQESGIRGYDRSNEHCWQSGVPRPRQRFRRLGRFKLPFVYKYLPNFCTSPSILRGYFARQSASFMDDSLDPEKQFHGGWNPALEEYANNFKAYIYSPEETPVIVDIGRVWREERGITKTVTNAVSTWDTVKI